MAARLFTNYDLGGFYDGTVNEDGLASPGQGQVVQPAAALGPAALRYRGGLRDDVLRSRITPAG